MSTTGSSCPVDHNKTEPPASCPVDHQAPAQACPVDHKAATSSPSTSIWAQFLPFSSSSSSSASSSQSTSSGATALSSSREVSSIPRGSADTNANWVYPSEAQFFAAMARKNHDPKAADMKSIVPIHNAVNERAWSEILKWEHGQGGEKCGGVRLVTFKGRPGDRSPRARWLGLLGYSPPFDRHDWVVDRCGVKTRYVIDFYTGAQTNAPGGNLSFYLDVRPALDSWDGIRMRLTRFWRN